jgi:hypothetical protein
MRETLSRWVFRRPWSPLAVAVAWMLLTQIICVFGWNAGWFGRYGALAHWLVVGVLPPALALMQQERAD